MTPTRSQLDAALPRVPSGIGAMAGDLTEPDEPGSDRAVALDWLCDLVGKATDQNTEDDIQATIEWLRSLRQPRDHSNSAWPPPLASRRVLSTRAYPPAPGITYYSPRTYTDDGGFVVKEFN